MLNMDEALLMAEDVTGAVVDDAIDVPLLTPSDAAVAELFFDDKAASKVTSGKVQHRA